MKRSLLRVFGIREEEMALLLPCVFYFALISAGIVIGKSARDALFLKNFGVEYLPYMYIITPIFVAVAATVSSYYIGIVHCIRFLYVSTLIFVVATIGILLGVYARATWFYPVMYVLVQLICALGVTYFWWLARGIFDSRQAKRLFPPIVGGGLVAGLLSGSAVSGIVQKTRVENLFLLWAALHGMGLVLLFFVSRGASMEIALIRNVGRKGQVKDYAREMTGLVKENRLFRMIIYSALFMWVISYFIDYEFSRAATNYFPDQRQLASFFGLFQAVLSSVALLFQVVIVGRLLTLIGVGNTPRIYSAVMTICSGILFLKYHLFTAVLAKFSNETFASTLDRVDSEIRYNALPDRQRNRASGLVGGLVKPLSAGLAGLTILLLPYPRVLSLLCVGLGLLWIWSGSKMRFLYVQTLVKNLTSSNLLLRANAREAIKELGDPRALEILAEPMKSSDPDTRRFALDIFSFLDLKGVPPALLDSLFHNDPTVRCAALRAIRHTKETKALEVVLKLCKDPNPAVAAEAVSTLGRLSPKHHLDTILEFTYRKEPSVRIAALAEALRISSAGGRNAILEHVRTLLKSPDEQERLMACSMIQRAEIRELLGDLLKLLEDPSIEVRSACIEALGRMGDRTLLSRLLPLCEERELKEAAFRALENLAPLCRPELLQLLHQSTLSMETRLLLPHILTKTGGDGEVQKALLDLLRGRDWRMRGAALRALCRLSEQKKKPPSRPLILEYAREEIQAAYLYELNRLRFGVAMPITALLRERTHQSLGRAFLALAMGPESRTLLTIHSKLSSPNQKLRAEALEAIEGILPREISLLIIPFYENWEPDQMAALADKEFGLQCGTRREALGVLASMEDPWIDRCLLFLASGRGAPVPGAAGTGTPTGGEIPDRLEKRRKDPEEESKMLETMEKLIFLKGVSLFESIPIEHLYAVAELAEERPFPAGRIIFEEDSFGDALYVVLSGDVDIVKGKGAGKTAIARLGEREYFGEMALLDDLPRSAGAEAANDVRLLVIEKERFREVMRQRPEVSLGIIRVLSNRMRGMLDRVSGG